MGARQQWLETLGRVAFLNCDPLYHGLGNEWSILPAPPAWLTGHLLQKDCLIAPIPSADYAQHCNELILLPDIGISSNGHVGSVLLFGNSPIQELSSIALPSDSATSKRLLMYLLKHRGLEPETVEMGPDLDEMLERCDGALLIGDRALWESENNPEKVLMDLGHEWKELTGLPMVFAVFAACRDAPIDSLRNAHASLLSARMRFLDKRQRAAVVSSSSVRSRFDSNRIDQYFDEVSNALGDAECEGLALFLREVCGMKAEVEFVEI